MDLKQLLDGWQALLDKCPVGRHGFLRIRPDLVRQYQTPHGIYVIQAPDEDNGFCITDVANGSKITEVTAEALHQYAHRRLMVVTEDLQLSWDCELMQEDDGFFVASFFNCLGARLTIHGIEMTKNWCGVISDRGVIVQC